MNEAETRAELIDPALHAAGWGVVDGSRTRREVIAPGRLMGSGNRAKPKACDYVLTLYPTLSYRLKLVIHCGGFSNAWLR